MSGTGETFPVRFGDFALLSSLGVGGMGRVYLAAHSEWPGLVVLKRLHAHLKDDPVVFRRFLHEAKTATHVRHPAVAGAIAVGTVGPEPFFATEYVFGLPLSVLVDHMDACRLPLPPLGVGLYLALDLAKGLEAIHGAVDRDTGTPLELLHRDIGSRNAMIGFDGRLRIIDLGLGRSLLADWETAADTVAGSPDYMPPEQAAGERVDRRADVYSAAVTIFELLAGKKRIRAETLAERLHLAVTAQPESIRRHRQDVSAPFDLALASAMAPRPEARMPHVGRLRAALEDELSRVNPRPRRKDVVEWLERHCESERAKSRAMRREAERLAGLALSDPTQETQIHAIALPVANAEVDPFEHALSESTLPRAPVATPAATSPSRWRAGLIGVGLGAVVLLVLGLARTSSAPQFEPAATESTSTSGGRSPITEAARAATAAPDVTPTTTVAAPEAESERAPVTEPNLARPIAKPLPPALSERKRGLASRLQSLRRSRFDVAYQRQLTQVGQGLSRARSATDLDEVERRIRRLEADR